jgi:polyvinyl alcohol dehydrogenase (cytochrome)
LIAPGPRHAAPHISRDLHLRHLLSGGVGVALAASITIVEAATGSNDANWSMYNHDATGTRVNSAETTIGTGNAASLHVKLTVNTPAPVSATPIVSDGVVYAGDMSGAFYAVKTDGTLLWSKPIDASGITASAAIAANLVVVGSLGGTVYGINRNDGSVAWSMRPDPHPLAAIFGSPTRIGNYLAIGVASNEEYAAGNPSYTCCSTRGSLVLLDPRSGAVISQTFMITDAERAAGVSGSSIWSTPSYDPASKLIYVTTGNNFSQPTNGTSDAIVAIDSTTGKIVWVNQRTPNDQWTFHFPADPSHPDYDFGDSPQIYTLPSGQKVVGAGQKSGFYHVVDAQTGALVNQLQVEPGGSLGGLFADTAVWNGVVYANGINWPSPSATNPPTAGDLIAIAGDGSHELWRFTTQYSPDMAGVAVANGVVYFTSTFSGYLFALDATNGTLLNAISVGTSDSGPSVSNGQIYVGTGDAIGASFLGKVGPGTITALGL